MLKFLLEALRTADRSDPNSLWTAWRANLAMAFFDEMKESGEVDETNRGSMLTLCNRAANRFLNTLTAGANVAIPKDDPRYFGKWNSDCLMKAAEDEPIFVLRGQDVSSPNIVIEWANQNINTCPPEKIRDAFDTALAMIKFRNRKIAD